jgi:hypothetical protein
VRPAGRTNKKPAAGFSGGGLDFLYSFGFLFYPPPEDMKPLTATMTIMEPVRLTRRGVKPDVDVWRNRVIMIIYLKRAEKSTGPEP